MGEKLRFAELPNTGDVRGSSFTLSPAMVSFLGRIEDIHVSSVLPGHVRGNHFHTRKKEVLIVVHQSEWSLHWDDGESTSVRVKEFSGQGAEVVLIEPGCSHAVRNTGASELTILALNSEAYDPRTVIPRRVT
jgi:UDP-2-acetamido-2,6-beta-L-arabino-hexul-4-ose reductase